MKNAEYKTPTIVAIDDMFVNLIMVETHLEDLQVNLITKTSPVEVINEIESLNPDIILMDLIMPDMDGTEAARLIKQNEKTKHVPIIAISASKEEIDKVANDQLFSTTLKKPFTKEELFNVLSRFISIQKVKAEEPVLQKNETRFPKRNRLKTPIRKLLQIETESTENELSGIQFNGPTILAIDDIEVNLLLLESYVEGHNIKLLTKTSVLEAIKDLPSIRPDLILMDIMMSELNGREAARRIKEDVNTQDIPIVSFTVNEEERQKTTIEKNFSGTLGKPFNKTQLFELLYQFLPYTENGVAGDSAKKITKNS